MKARLLFAALSLAHVFALADGVDFIQPKDGDTVEPTFLAKFAVTGMEVSPAGEIKPGTGHHHLLVDAPLPDLSQPVPKDAQHLHFGGGQTETTLTLAPGKHTLQLLLGDFAHVPHQPPVMSEVVTITVE